jgi:ribosomal protein L11 methyltransferase
VNESASMNEPPRYPYVAIDVAGEEADDASALLFELGAAGVEERDATTLSRGAAGRTTLVGSFGLMEEAKAAASHMPEAWLPRIEEVVGDAWRDEWKKYFEPFRVCTGVVVRPPWREHTAEHGERVVVLEPGRAFGTGLHETTSLIAEALAARSLEGVSVLDVGCGSGILGLVALALGAARVRAIDVDPDAVAVTRENAERNGVGPCLQSDDTPVGLVSESYDAVLANIDSTTLIDLAPALIERILPGGLLVLSGILSPEVAPAQLAEVRRAFGELEEEEVSAKGEWIALRMHKPNLTPP